MASELLDIHPGELKFTFELRKQSSCSIQLFNKSNHYVAFKSPPLNEGHKPREQGTSAHNSALNGIENLHPAYAQKSILQLWDEKNSAIREEGKLRQEALLLRRKYAAGARLDALLVCFVVLVVLTLGCWLHS